MTEENKTSFESQEELISRIRIAFDEYCELSWTEPSFCRTIRTVLTIWNLSRMPLPAIATDIEHRVAAYRKDRFKTE